MKRQQMLLLGLGIFILIISGGYFYYRYEKYAIRQEKYSELKTIADLKISQIMHWREERLADAHVISESPFIRQSFHRWLLSEDSTPEKDILERFSLLKYYHKYEDVFVISAEGKLLLGIDTTLKQVDSVTIDCCKKALRDRKIILSDLYFCPTHNTIHFDIMAPISNEKNAPVAVLVLRDNPYDYLYPFIQSWPTSSKSAETLIIRRDGDSILYENELRHTTNTALKLRIPLSSIEIPAVQAVLGHAGIWEGKDYRGEGKYSQRKPGNPAVLLLDIKMPRMDGIEVLKAIRSNQTLHMLPVVMLTSSREEQDVIKSYELGVNAYVVKPVDFKEFIEAVKQLGIFWAVINEIPPGNK